MNYREKIRTLCTTTDKITGEADFDVNRYDAMIKEYNLNRTDMLGNKIKAGDVMLEVKKTSFMKGEEYTHLRLWEMPESFNGSGYYYNIDGAKHKFSWVDNEDSLKVDMSLMPDGFEYSFKHGMRDFKTSILEGTLDELIKTSNWKENEVKKEDVDHFIFMKNLKIETLDDIKKNIVELKKFGYVPPEIISSVLKISKTNMSIPNNGETGIASFYNDFNYVSIIEEIANDL